MRPALFFVALLTASTGASANDDLPWMFTNGQAEGYSVAPVSAEPRPGTMLCAGTEQHFTATVQYSLQLRDKGRLVLVFQDGNDHAIPGAQMDKTITKGTGTAMLSNSLAIPVNASEIRMFIPLVPDGIEQTSGELVLRYPVKACK